MRSYQELVERALQKQTTISRIVIEEEKTRTGRSETELVEKMKANYTVMQESVVQGMTGTWKSLSGLTGGDAALLENYRLSGKSLLGDKVNRAAARAMAVAEVNAGMGRIVAAPTAGSCGVLPGVLLTVNESLCREDDAVVAALFTAAGIGMVIAERASVSGAEGGCQAEIGAAAAMSAAAAVELAGGTPEQTAHASAMALKSFLGLVCDPVAGLVEVPCVKRNASAAVIALTAAEMALAGIKSAIPLDEVIDAMASIGRNMPCSLKETAQGGLAVTPAAEKLRERLVPCQP
ncbi:L-serine ammonia-lyase, iron-sulfur-dependent, subunit alpha [Dehalobacter sp. DCM]|uniref:L-serine ammonia-lyase, iron-sulfur-dependent, subunit alpha n=1 Tax=Dehalobacter sp. DCM TaxID=2907827 RepID=UPI003081630F|nr:L-serine ammonia-lyase, iron-sulfur-dependent, subunit alpha [Dehalobacter sp. DCM]